MLRDKSIRIQNAKCHLLLLFSICLSKTSNIRNCKNFSNTAIMPSYFYDGTVDYCICVLIFFILSLSSVRLLNSLFPHFVSLCLSELLSTLTLSLCAVGWASMPVCGSWVCGLVDQWVWISGFCGFFFFFFWL